MINGSLMKVESIAECSILQYFRPALSHNWSWKPICGYFESGRFTQVLLYLKFYPILYLRIKQGARATYYIKDQNFQNPEFMKFKSYNLQYAYLWNIHNIKFEWSMVSR